GGVCVFFFQGEDGIRDWSVTGVQTCALPISGLGLPLDDIKERVLVRGGWMGEGSPWFHLHVQIGEGDEGSARAFLAAIFAGQDQIGRASCRERGERSVGGE